MMWTLCRRFAACVVVRNCFGCLRRSPGLMAVRVFAVCSQPDALCRAARCHSTVARPSIMHASQLYLHNGRSGRHAAILEEPMHEMMEELADSRWCHITRCIRDKSWQVKWDELRSVDITSWCFAKEWAKIDIKHFWSMFQCSHRFIWFDVLQLFHWFRESRYMVLWIG